MIQNTSSVVIAPYKPNKLAMYDKEDGRLKEYRDQLIHGTFKVNDNFNPKSNDQEWGIFTTLGGMRYKINRSWEVTGLIIGKN